MDWMIKSGTRGVRPARIELAKPLWAQALNLVGFASSLWPLVGGIAPSWGREIRTPEALCTGSEPVLVDHLSIPQHVMMAGGYWSSGSVSTVPIFTYAIFRFSMCSRNCSSNVLDSSVESSDLSLIRVPRTRFERVNPLRELILSQPPLTGLGTPRQQGDMMVVVGEQ